MKNETKQCQNCKNDFTIESDDFNFYEKIKVPSPTFCPECRLINRLLNTSERGLYKDTCDKCEKGIISLFAPETSFTVYCSRCWWGDSWDGTQFGKDYDFTKPFFEQFFELQKVVPCQATNIINSINCNFCNGIHRCKNCTYVFSGLQSINCYYCSTPILSKDILDSDFSINTDHTYEVLNSVNLYNTKYAYFSNECLDCAFLYNCLGCSDCFGCVNLRNQKYCIWNIQYTKEEYEKEILKWNLGSYKTIEIAKQKFIETYLKTPIRFALISNSVNVSGDNIKNSKNCHMCFSASHGVENCKYVFQVGLSIKDSYDMTLGGDNSELLYEVTGSTQSQRTLFTRSGHNVMNVEYSENIFTGNNLFGCARLRHKKYCILNKQYSKEEYEKLIPKIKQHMNEMPFIDKQGRVYKYGDYFPFEHAMWAYNESWAHQYFPLTKIDAIKKGFRWRDPVEKEYKITIKSENLPDDIKDVSDLILDEVIECEHNTNSCNQQCTNVFRILQNELALFRSMNVALPRLCPNCRHYERIKRVNPQKLWHRKCMCNGVESNNREYKNTTKHFHGDNACSNEFETVMSDERKEIVYCKECYQSEFI